MDHHEGIQRQPEMNDKKPAESPPPATDAAADAEQDVRWLARNGPLLGLLAILITFAAWYFQVTLDSWFTIGKVAAGLGIVIFIHELGHFLVAKWCDVHVTMFSIGFGPALPGCRFQWGETTYKLALFPLGGYVQMVGQVDGDESADGSEDDPRSYRNKSVWQRMAIISAGVVMNAILAIVCFIVVFQGPGKDRQAAVVASIDTGAPAFVHGIRTGAEIKQIGNIEHPYFEQLMVRVMGTVSGERLTFVSNRPEDKAPQQIEIEPRLNRFDKRPMLGISPASRLLLAPRLAVPDPYTGPVYPGSAAARATPAFEFGDEIVGVTHPDYPDDAKKMDLPPDPRKTEQRDYFEFSRRLQRLAGKPVTIRVRRGEDGYGQELDILVPPAFHYKLGMRMQMGQISAIRLVDSPAADAKLQARQTDANGILTREGDVILRAEVPEPDGKVTIFEDKTLDPVRLPYELRRWAERYRAGHGFDKSQKLVKLKVKRHRNAPGQQFEIVDATLTWNDDWRFEKQRPFTPVSPLAIPELGLAYQVKNIVADAEPGHPLEKNEVIKKIRFSYDKNGKKDLPWETFKTDDQWAYAWDTYQSPGLLRDVTVAVERDGEIKEIVLTGTPDDWPAENRGLVFERDVRRQRADSMLEAVAFGFEDTWSNMVQVFQNLRGMILGRISTENLGGPVTIAKVAFRIAGHDFWEFVFFIGLISVNLAVINFLPIPVLDGGHMVFLIYEKLRGKPASEGIRIGATYAGLALVLSLMVYVLYLDFFVH